MAIQNKTISCYVKDGYLQSGVRSNGARLLARATFPTSNHIPPEYTKGSVWSDSHISGGVLSVEDNAVKLAYPNPVSAVYCSLNLNIPPGHKELFVKFRAKMPGNKNGCKFLKVFGEKTGSESTTNVANCTFGLDYTGIADGRGSMYAVSFGDGNPATNKISNDTDNMIKFNNSDHILGRNAGIAAIAVKGENFIASNWGTDWHTFRLHVKFNDGDTALNEIPNGKFTVKIDTYDYVVASGLFNRHYTNKPIDYLAFGNQSQGGGGAFDIYFDDIYVSTGNFYED